MRILAWAIVAAVAWPLAIPAGLAWIVWRAIR